jgi:hypothetical protein
MRYLCLYKKNLQFYVSFKSFLHISIKFTLIYFNVYIIRIVLYFKYLFIKICANKSSRKSFYVTYDDYFKTWKEERLYEERKRISRRCIEECFWSKYTTQMYEKVILNQAPVAIVCNLRYLGGWNEENWIQASLGQKIQKHKIGNTCSQKIAKERRARGVTQVVQYLPSKYKALRYINLHN